MIIQTKQNFVEDSYLEKLSNKLLLHCFTLINLILDYNVVNSLTFKLLTLMELLQTLYFALIPEIMPQKYEYLVLASEFLANFNVKEGKGN
jgi:hypothetical protein